jgi:hypothetical protein
MDFGKVLKGIVEGAKVEGLELVEEQAAKLAGVVISEVEKELAQSDSAIAKAVGASVLPVLKAGLLSLIDKIDGTKDL